MSAIQIKNVPDDVHDALRERAARGATIGDYLLELIRRDLRRNRTEQWYAELAAMPPPAGGTAPVDSVSLVRESREERDRELDAAIDPTFTGRAVRIDHRVVGG